MESIHESSPGAFEQEAILRSLSVVRNESESAEGALRLDDSALEQYANHEKKLALPVTRPEELYGYFENIRVVEPDKILRPSGDTTIFTSAGVQHIETKMRNEGGLNRDVFIIAQPVIRSQYMDKVKDGSSSAFVNFSVEAVETDLNEFSDLCQKMIAMIQDRGADARDIRFTIETIPDKWGDRAFTKTVLTVIANGIEIGEGVYMHDYPVDENRKIAIADICFGVERLNWALGDRECFMPEYKKFYSQNPDTNAVTGAIDCMRSAVLMAGEGVKPAHTDPGFRLRRLSKKFVDRNKSLGFDAAELIDTAWDHWLKWGFRPDITKEEAKQVIEDENMRGFNNMVLSMIEQKGGPRVTINVNQSTEAFFRQMDISLPPQTKELFRQVKKELDKKT